MARTTLDDFYQSHRFHLFDISPSSAFGGFGAPFLALSPQIGFSSVTAPTLTLETEEIRPGNTPFPVEVVKGSKVEAMTLQRGVFVGDNEFYTWIRQAQYGRGKYRRNLLLVHLQSETPGGDEASGVIPNPRRLASVFIRVSAALAAGSAGNVVGDAVSAAVSGVTGIAARVFILKDCIPIRYKAGTDFDALNDGVSIQELDISVEDFTEITLGAPPFIRGAIS